MLKHEIAIQTLWRGVTLLVAFALLALSTVTLAAQDPYYQPNNSVRSPLPALRAAQARGGELSPAFLENPPRPHASQDNNSERYAALTKTFRGSGISTLRASGSLQDVFENPASDAFGEGTQLPAGNPFQKVAPPSGNRIDDPSPKNPFNLLPTDPTPQTPPMDTRPSLQEGVAPVLPPGSEYTPNPNRFPSDPPIPGQGGTDPPLEDPVPVPVPRSGDTEDPGEITADDVDQGDSDDSEGNRDDNSVFDRADPPNDDDLPPVPAPASSRVYLPANTPSDYENPLSNGAVHRGYGKDPRQQYDPRYAGINPYAGLPGPYGYAAPPQGYPPYPMPYMMPPMGPYGYGYGYGYGQCGPGCKPIDEDENRCGLLCDPCTISKCGGCHQSPCSNDNRPMLPQTDIGDRILETGLVDSCACGDEAYTEVIGDCDDYCSNYASCYVSLFGGVSNLNDFITQDDNGRGIYFDDTGSIFGFSIGQVQGRNLRTELELSYRNIGVSGLRLEGDAGDEFLAVNGDFGTFSGMLNAYWEFVDVRFEKVKPYIGAGVGFAIARPELLQANGVEAVIDNNDSSFAYQLMAGLNYKASSTLDAFVEYRYFVADSFQLNTEIPLISGLGNGSGQFDYQSSNVIFGLRARF